MRRDMPASDKPKHVEIVEEMVNEGDVMSLTPRRRQALRELLAENERLKLSVYTSGKDADAADCKRLLESKRAEDAERQLNEERSCHDCREYRQMIALKCVEAEQRERDAERRAKEATESAARHEMDWASEMSFREKAEAQRDALIKALEGLVKINEEHNAAMSSVIGKPVGWKDSYLDAARAAFAAVREKP